MHGDWESMLCVTRDLPSTEITHVNFSYHSLSGKYDYVSDWREIARTLSTKNVRVFEFTHFSMFRKNSPCGNIDLRVSIEPLFAFHNLETLDLTFNDEMDEGSTITDDDIRRLASALPNLINLDICLRKGHTRLTVGALVHLATTSAKLECLLIDINLEIDGLDALPDPTDVPCTSSPVWDIMLRLKPPPPADQELRNARTKLLAGVLDRLFPELENISIEGGWNEEELGDAVFALQDEREAQPSSRQ